MPCYTKIVLLEDSAINRKARAKLGFFLQGTLTIEQAGRVRIEAGIMRTQAALRTLSPTAVIRREGNTLKISVNI